jgi:hypothetical protein
MRPKVYADGKVDIKRQREDEKCKSQGMFRAVKAFQKLFPDLRP